LTCPSHMVNIAYDGPALSRIHLDRSEKYGGNRDFILKYRLAGGRIETGLLLFEGKEENFFLLMVQPPKRVSEDQIPPREYIFIVDVSGSMHGFPLDISKKLLKDLIGTLRPTDRFNVLLFSGGSSLMAERSLPATPENIRHAITIIERQRGGDGTRLLPALKRALALPKTEGCSRSVVIATDGYVSVEEEAFDLIRRNLGNANVFTFGIGSSVNRHLIEGMARVGMGEPFIITKPQEAPETAQKFRKLIQSPVLTGITVDFGQFQVYDVEPESIPDVLADRPVIVFGKWRGKPRGSIEVRSATGTGSFAERLNVDRARPLEANSALRYLWGRHRITLLADYNSLSPNDERVREVTSLGLTYNLLTAYTSFIAIDARVRAADGKTVTVKQPLPLPQGVSDLAVGNEMSFKTKAQVSGAAPLTMAGECSPQREQLQSKDETSTSDTASSEMIHMAIKEVVVSEGAPVHLFKTAIESALPAINTCYRTGAGSSPKGEVAFTLVVGTDGRVKKASLQRDQSRFTDFESCMVKRLKALQFPARAGGNEVLVTITFTLG
jgi:Ca-activated chloride channel family protein